MMAHKMMLVPVERNGGLATPSPEDGKDYRLDTEVILSAIPKNYKTRAQALLNHITADPQHRLRWNQQGELIYRGQVIPGSHITDLLKNSQRQYRHSQPVGVREFQDGLKELNIPVGLMEARPGPPGQRIAHVPEEKWLTV